MLTKAYTFSATQPTFIGVLLQVFFAIYLIISAISIFVLCAESAPQFWSVTNITGNISTNNTKEWDYHDVPGIITVFDNKLVSVELATNTFFTGLSVARLLASPDFKSVLTNIPLLLGLFSVSSSWVVYFSRYYKCGDLLNLPYYLRVLVLVRCTRTWRALRLLQVMRGWELIVLTIKRSVWELGVLCAFFISSMVIFATLMYFAEYSNADTYQTIPMGYWWAIITMTTVGYGDMYPTTPCGYAVGAVCAIMGLFAASMPIPIISNNFCQLRHDLLQVYDQNERMKTPSKDKGLCQAHILNT